MKKVLLAIVGVIVLVVAGGGIFVATKKPAQRPASTEKVVSTPELVARGQYLAETLSCVMCHTPPNPTRWSQLGDDDKRFSGGFCWKEEQSFPGTLCAPNLTPDPATGLGNWTDGEISRAIREGVDREGNALFPLMPYLSYAALPDQDVAAMVAYLRSLRPVNHAVTPRVLKPPMNIIVKFIPKPLDGPVAAVSKSDPVAYGKYLTTVASCKECHTPVDDHHKAFAGKEFSGGQIFQTPAGAFTSANLTPHETGLGARTKEMFLATFRSFADPAFRDIQVKPADNTIMPWLTISKMTSGRDLRLPADRGPRRQRGGKEKAPGGAGTHCCRRSDGRRYPDRGRCPDRPGCTAEINFTFGFSSSIRRSSQSFSNSTSGRPSTSRTQVCRPGSSNFSRSGSSPSIQRAWR